ncbi:MAG: NUDIX hydrolase [Armatimonadota bacterium]|nr:NUDIX hydrolase [Armatimonadota bacterium]
MHTDLRYPVPAVAAIIVRDGEILLVKRGAEPGFGKWSIPGGSVELGETLEYALKREILEETGLAVEVGKLAGISDLIIRDDDVLKWHYVLINFFAAITGGELCPATDVSECRWVRLSEIRTYNVTQSVLNRLEELGLIAGEF